MLTSSAKSWFENQEQQIMQKTYSVESFWTEQCIKISPPIKLMSCIHGNMIFWKNPDLLNMNSIIDFCKTLNKYFIYKISKIETVIEKYELSDENFDKVINEFKQIVENKIGNKLLKDLNPEDTLSLTNNERNTLLYAAYIVGNDLRAAIKIFLGIYDSENNDLLFNEIEAYNDFLKPNEGSADYKLINLSAKATEVKTIWKLFLKECVNRVFGVTPVDLVDSFIEGKITDEVFNSKFPSDHLYHTDQQLLLKRKFLSVGWEPVLFNEGVLCKTIKGTTLKVIAEREYKDNHFIGWKEEIKEVTSEKGILVYAYFGIDNGWRNFESVRFFV